MKYVVDMIGGFFVCAVYFLNFAENRIESNTGHFMETAPEYWHHSKWWFLVTGHGLLHWRSLTQASEIPHLMVYNLTDDNITETSNETVIPVKCNFPDRTRNLAIFSAPQHCHSNSNLQNKHKPNLKLSLKLSALFYQFKMSDSTAISVTPVSAWGGCRQLHIASNTHLCN